jgi:DNA-binding LacI/PurR family transcriptional regulator
LPSSLVTVRSLARILGLSRATVSSALRGTGRVAPETARRVREVAEKSGYRHNPLAGTLMSELRRSRGGTFRGVLATVDLREPDRPDHGPFHRELIRGAQKRAAELGFNLEQFIVAEDDLTLPRLDTILQSRGIHGLLLLPSWRAPDFSALSWNRYTAVYTDYNLARPHLHSVCSDHYSSMLTTLETLEARGYQRPGLVIEEGRNERLHRRHAAAFHAFAPSPKGHIPIPALITPELSRSTFVPWFERYRPDVVLCHFPVAIEWMEACGARVPQEQGFVCLNVLHKTRPCAALDLQPREIGARGIELVIAQLHRNERGIPASPCRTIISSRWIEGPTVRPLAVPKKSRSA